MGKNWVEFGTSSLPLSGDGLGLKFWVMVLE